MSENRLEYQEELLNDAYQAAIECPYSPDWPEPMQFIRELVNALTYVDKLVTDKEKQLALVKKYAQKAERVSRHISSVAIIAVTPTLHKQVSDKEYIKGITIGSEFYLYCGDAIEAVFESGEVVKQTAVPLWRTGCSELERIDALFFKGQGILKETIDEYTLKIQERDPETYQKELAKIARKHKKEVQRIQEELLKRYGDDVLAWFDVNDTNSYGGAWPFDEDLLQSFHMNDAVAVFTKECALKKIAWVNEINRFYLKLESIDKTRFTIDAGDFIVLFDKGIGIPILANYIAKKKKQQQRKKSIAAAKAAIKNPLFFVKRLFGQSKE